jgi:hypothetical protein
MKIRTLLASLAAAAALSACGESATAPQGVHSAPSFNTARTDSAAADSTTNRTGRPIGSGN